MTPFEQTLALFAASVLVVFRLALLLTSERGPYNVFGRLRAWAGAEVVKEQARDSFGNMREVERLETHTELGEVFTCFYCMSLWVALPFALIFAMLYDLPLLLRIGVWLLAWQAIAGAAFWLKAGLR